LTAWAIISILSLVFTVSFYGWMGLLFLAPDASPGGSFRFFEEFSGSGDSPHDAVGSLSGIDPPP